jgi:hypothetical protein
MKGIQKSNRRLGFNMAISEEDRRIIEDLREKYSVNISNFLKNALRAHHAILKEGKQ